MFESLKLKQINSVLPKMRDRGMSVKEGFNPFSFSFKNDIRSSTLRRKKLVDNPNGDLGL